MASPSLMCTTYRGSNAAARMTKISPRKCLTLAGNDRLRLSRRWFLKNTRNLRVRPASTTLTRQSCTYDWMAAFASTLSANGKRGPTCLAGRTHRVGITTAIGLHPVEGYSLDLSFMVCTLRIKNRVSWHGGVIAWDTNMGWSNESSWVDHCWLWSSEYFTTGVENKWDDKVAFDWQNLPFKLWCKQQKRVTKMAANSAIWLYKVKNVNVVCKQQKWATEMAANSAIWHKRHV